MASDPTLVLNESELQAVLQLKLLERLPQIVRARLQEGTIARSHHPRLEVPRVFRELKLDAGRSATEADLVVLTNTEQVVVPKSNGAPKAFQPPLEAVIETKLDTSSAQFLLGKAGPSVVPGVLADLARWKAAVEEGRIRQAFAVVLTPRPERYQGLDGVLAIRHNSDGIADWNADGHDRQMNTAVLTKDAASAAISCVHERHQRQPVGLLREKDFEAHLFRALRLACRWTSRHPLPSGRVVAINPVRTQWHGPWASTLAMRRRHDVVVLRPDGSGLHAELEVKTSHSDSHNWFRKSEVEKEMSAISQLIAAGQLDFGAFIMFRYGLAMWETDAFALSARYPSVAFRYLCS